MKLFRPCSLFCGAFLLAFSLGTAAAQVVAAKDKPAPAESNPLQEAMVANNKAQAAYYEKQARQGSSHELPPWANGVLPLVGVLIGGVSSYWVAKLQTNAAFNRTYKLQKAQAGTTFRDLQATLSSLDLNGMRPLGFLQESYLVDVIERPANYEGQHPYQQKYELVNLIYRLCAVLGWMELYRVDPTFLRGPAAERRKIDAGFRTITKALSAGFVQEKATKLAGDPATPPWQDDVILEDDQRNIGEVMLVAATKDSPATVLGYRAFCETLFRYASRDAAGAIHCGDQNFWIWNATRFVVGMGKTLPAVDYRRRRMMMVLQELMELEPVLNTR